MRVTRFGRSRWQRQMGVVGLVAAGAILLASCSSGPSGVNAPGAPAEAPRTSAHVKTVEFPSGPVAEHIYGPSWARFVAAFPGKVTIGVSNAIGSCAVGSRPQYDATAGTPLTGSEPAPPSYDVLVWRCRTSTKAADFLRSVLASVPVRSVVVSGVHGFAVTVTGGRFGPNKALVWGGSLAFRTGSTVYVIEPFAKTSAAARAFLRSFRFDLAGYTPAS